MAINRNSPLPLLLCLLGMIGIVCPLKRSEGAEPFRIEVRDRANNWPVPLVELKTTHHLSFVTDNAGVVAIDTPEMMGTEVWFHVSGHGYTVPEDGFGYRGKRITPLPGQSATIFVDRQLPAKRLGRITGGGQFAHSQKLGHSTAWKEQNLWGCDSVQITKFQDRLFWIWGDSVLPGYPLGRYNTSGATTDLQPLLSYKPPIELRYQYFVDEKQVPREIARMPGKGPTWLMGLTNVKDKKGNEHLVATYSKIEGLVAEYERGLCRWNPETNQFEQHKVLWQKSEQKRKPSIAPMGHAIEWTDENGEDWRLFGDPFPTLKCRATLESWENPEAWIALTPQPQVSAADQSQSVQPHRGNIGFNKYRNKWVAIFTQNHGKTSSLGELWYAEANSPIGPWENAIHVVTHNKYTFYNPKIHETWTNAKGSILTFEATYTYTFSGNDSPTPRHDYNQVLYRLDLDELFQQTR